MNDETEKPVEFPQYTPPQGVPTLDPRQQKPLTKMIKNLMKPMKQRDPFHSRRTHRRTRKQVRFY